MTTLRFHDKAVALLRSPINPSADAVNQVEARERALGIRLPASLREWYSLEGASVLLAGAGPDNPVPIAELGVPINSDAPKAVDLLAAGILAIMWEEQAVCLWAVRLDGSEDPPVVVAVDPWETSEWGVSIFAPQPTWMPCADHFSTFVYCWLWDHLRGPLGGAEGASMGCQAVAFDPALIAKIGAQFTELPRTFGWPGKTAYRFFGQGVSLLIWEGDEGGADWFVHAASRPHLDDVVMRLRALGAELDGAYYP